MSDLVKRLSQGSQEVEIEIRPEPTVQAFYDRVENGYVHVRFPNTKGGTTLGVRLDKALTDMADADFTEGRGHVKLVGNLTLDYVKVRCYCDIELATLKGSGHLEPVVEAEATTSQQSPT